MYWLQRMSEFGKDLRDAYDWTPGPGGQPYGPRVHGGGGQGPPVPPSTDLAALILSDRDLLRKAYGTSKNLRFQFRGQLDKPFSKPTYLYTNLS